VKVIKEITIEMTNECPLECLHCSTKNSPFYVKGIEKYKKEYEEEIKTADTLEKHIEVISKWNNIYRKNFDIKSDDLSSDQLIQIAKDIVDKDKKSNYRIRFSGGEPMLILEQRHFNVLNRCKNIKEFIINTSGYEGIKKFTVEKATIRYRFSVYGNKIQHEHMTVVRTYNRLIRSIEEAIKMGYDVDFTCPVFEKSNVMNVIELAKKYNNRPIRLAKDIWYSFGTVGIKGDIYDSIVHNDCKRQLTIAEECKKIYPLIDITCSLHGECHVMCDYPKLTVLATGKIIGCAVEKQGCIDGSTY